MPISIEKLNASNYASWSSDMKFVLLERNAWSITKGTEVEPVLNDAKDNIKEVNDFRTRKRVALSLIYLFIEPEFRKIVENCNEPTESWKKLQDHFYPDNRSLHMSLFSELINCRIEVNEKIDLFAARLRRLFDRLQTLDSSISEIYLCFQLLRYLPPEFDSIVQTVLRLPESGFKFEKILVDLIAEETRISLRARDQLDQYTAQITYKDPYYKKDSIKCFRCKKTGHFKNACPERRQRASSGTRQRDSRTMRGDSSRPRWNERGRPTSREVRQNSPTRYEQPRTSSSERKCFHFYVAEANINEARGNQSDWIFDTAASHHFCSNKNLFHDFLPLKDEKMAVAIQGATFPIEGKGKVKLKFGQRTICLTDVMYSSKLRRNLISGPRFDRGQAVFYGGKGAVSVSDPEGNFIFQATLKNGVYQVKPEIPNKNSKHVSFHTSAGTEKMYTWHKRLAHVNTDTIIRTGKCNSVFGLPNFGKTDISCERCKLNKFRRISFKGSNYTRAKRPLELLYADVWGPCQIKGRGGERYFLSIIDDFSKRTSLYPIKEKGEVPEILKRHINKAERFVGQKVKAIRTDNGGEFVNRNFDNFCDKSGITHELTNAYTPEQNGTAERFNQTVVDGTRTILEESGLEKHFWPEAMLYFTYTWNRVCHKDQVKTPFELYGGKRPSVRHLKAFGTIAYMGIPKQLRHKLEAKAKRGVLVGYAFRTKGYRIWIPEENKIIETINVSFKEESFYGDRSNSNRSGAVLGTTVNWRLNSHQAESDSDRDDAIEVPVRRQPFPDTPAELQESTSAEETSDDDLPRLRRDAVWIRKVVPRPDGSRNDIYYYEKGKNSRLRSLTDVKRYCSKYKIAYEPNLFSFKGKDKSHGEVTCYPSTSNVTDA